MLDLQQPPTSEVLNPQPQALQAFFMALQSYPDFVDGLRSGRLVYNETYYGEPLTPDKVLKEIDEVLSQKNCDGFVLDLKTHGEHLQAPFIYLLGQVLGEITEGIQA